MGRGNRIVSNTDTAATTVTGEASASLEGDFTFRRAKERGIEFVLFLCALLSIATTIGIIVVLAERVCVLA